MDYYDETALSEQYGHDYGEVDNITPPIAGNWFDKANQLFLNDNAESRSAHFIMDRSDSSLNLVIALDIYDNPQIDMNEFTSLTPYHIDDYNMDFYGLYKTFDGDPIRNITKGIFLYHDKLYILHTTNFSRKETMQIVYEILDSGLSANDLYEQYTGDIISWEDERTTEETVPEAVLDLKTANKLAFCYGLVPEFYTMNGENQREIDGSNMTMDGEYSYENTYDDSELLWNADSIQYTENDEQEELSYKYTNEDCELNVYYFTYTDELRENSAVPWTEDTSLKTLLKEPYCTNAEGQDDNSRLKNFDFIVDLGNHTAVQLTGTCTVNHIDYFILQLRVMTASFDAVPDKEALFAEMNAQPYCMGIIPEVQDIDILHLKTANIYSDEPDGASTQVDLKYEYHERQEYVIPDEHPYMIIAFFDETENEGLLSVDELTEEKLEEMGAFSEDVCWFAVKHPYGSVSICAGYCTKEQIMTYVNLLKERIESVTE